MNDIRLRYSETRGTWNVIINGEWYFEGNYEQASEVFQSYYWLEQYDDDEFDY